MIVRSLLAFNAILASVLGGGILYKGMSRKRIAQMGSRLGLVAFGLADRLFAKDLRWWSAGLLPSVFAIATLKQDLILTRVSARCESAIDHITRANLVPIKVSSDNRHSLMRSPREARDRRLSSNRKSPVCFLSTISRN